MKADLGQVRPETAEFMAFYFSDLQLVASPDVNAAVKETLRATAAYITDHGGQEDVFNALTRLAISCRKDSAKELQLNPEEERRIEENSKVVTKMFEGAPKPPAGIKISPE